MVVVTARTRDVAVPCPVCGTATAKVHGYHQRTVTDVPVDGRQVVVRLRVRRLVCPARNCPRQTFREQIPGLLERHHCHPTARGDPQTGLHRQRQPSGPLPQPVPRRRRPPRHDLPPRQPPPAHQTREPAPEGHDPAGANRRSLPRETALASLVRGFAALLTLAAGNDVKLTEWIAQARAVDLPRLRSLTNGREINGPQWTVPSPCPTTTAAPKASTPAPRAS